MMAASDDIADAWVTRYVRNQDAYVQILAADPFRDWDQNAMPEVSVSMELIEALRIAYAKGLGDIEVQAFANRAAQVAQRAIDEDSLTTPLTQSSFPLNRAVLYRDYAYALALRGQPLDTTAVGQAVGDFETWCAGYKKSDWDSQAQANYLSAVRLSLLVGDIVHARELLGTRKSFKWHKIEHDLWNRLANKGRDARNDHTFRTAYQGYFDKLRDPRVLPDVYMETDIVRFELAAIRDRYLVSGDESIDWQRVVEAVAGSKLG